MAKKKIGREVIIKYKRFAETSLNFYMNNESNAISVKPGNTGKKYYEHHEQFKYYKGEEMTYIQMEEGIGAHVITELDNYMLNTNIIPAGYHGLLYISLNRINNRWSKASPQSKELFSLIPFSTTPPYEIDKIILEDTTEFDKDPFYIFEKEAMSGSRGQRSRAIGSMMETDTQRANQFLNEKIIKGRKDSDIVEAFIIALQANVSEEYLPTLLYICNNYGYPILQLAAPLLVKYGNKDATQALVCAYEQTPFWDAEFDKKAKFDHNYADSIVKELCKMDDKLVVPTLYKALLNGSSYKTIILEKLFALGETHDNVKSYFKGYLTYDKDWRDFTDYKETAEWVYEQLGKIWLQDI